jgi:hypothetical protein
LPTGNDDELKIDQEAIYICHPDYIRDDEGFVGGYRWPAIDGLKTRAREKSSIKSVRQTKRTHKTIITLAGIKTPTSASGL